MSRKSFVCHSYGMGGHWPPISEQFVEIRDGALTRIINRFRDGRVEAHPANDMIREVDLLDPSLCR